MNQMMNAIGRAGNYQGPYGGRGGYMMDGGFWWPHLLGGLVGLFVLGLITWAIIRLVKHFTVKAEPKDEALEILKLKFVKGEISEEEFASKSKLLKS